MILIPQHIGKGAGTWFCRVHKHCMLVRVINSKNRYAGNSAYCPECVGGPILSLALSADCQPVNKAKRHGKFSAFARKLMPVQHLSAN